MSSEYNECIFLSTASTAGPLKWKLSYNFHYHHPSEVAINPSFGSLKASCLGYHVAKDGRLRSVPAPTLTPTPGQHSDSDSDSDSSWQKNDDSDSDSDSSWQKNDDSDSDLISSLMWQVGQHCIFFYFSYAWTDSKTLDSGSDSNSRPICWLRLRLRLQ